METVSGHLHRWFFLSGQQCFLSRQQTFLFGQENLTLTLTLPAVQMSAQPRHAVVHTDTVQTFTNEAAIHIGLCDNTCYKLFQQM